MVWLHSYCDLASPRAAGELANGTKAPACQATEPSPGRLGAGPWVRSPTDEQPNPHISGNTAHPPGKALQAGDLAHPPAPSGPCCYRPQDLPGSWSVSSHEEADGVGRSLSRSLSC